VSAVGCHREKQVHDPVKIYTEAELTNLISPGMSMTELTNKFGLPGAASEITSNTILFTYLYPFEVTRHEQGLHLEGFGVTLKDGRVLRWSPIMTESYPMFQGTQIQASLGEETFELLFQTDDCTNLLNTLDSLGSVDVSSLKISTAIVFKAQVYVESSDASATNKSLMLIIGDRDVPKLEKLTEGNLGKRMLIICRNILIAAPSVSMPLDSNKFHFPVKDTEFLNSLRKQ
jgi:hypothetical protein